MLLLLAFEDFYCYWGYTAAGQEIVAGQGLVLPFNLNLEKKKV
jgi:hypothetical protein